MHEVVRLSARTGAGAGRAAPAFLLQVAGWQSGRRRCILRARATFEALRAVDVAHLMEAAAQLEGWPGAGFLLAEELRLAQNALNSITGEFGADDLLG